MPILHAQILGQGQGPDGKTVQIPPQIALVQRGPVVQASLSLQGAFAATLVQQGQAVPNPVSGLALIDTGASTTCVDDSAALSMGLPVIDVCSMTSASHAKTQCNVYPVQIEIVGFKIQFQSPRTIGAELKAQGLLLLIGRDLLAVPTLFYNGITGQITLSI